MSDERESLSPAEKQRLFDALIQEVAAAGIDSSVDTSPHAFKPLKRWRNRGRCVACLIHEDHHPCPGWMPARAYGETREAVHLA